MFFMCFRVKADGLASRKAAVKPRLTEQHKMVRLQFAYENVGRPAEYWQSVFWTDEKTWRSDENGRVTLWRRRGTR